MILIEQNKYEHNLLEYFWTYQPVDEEDRKVVDLLSQVCRAWVNERDGESKHETISGISL